MITPLSELRGMYVLFTEQAGVLRALRAKEELSEAQGLHFDCPSCKGEHGVTLLFDFESVPKKAQPEGRYRPMGDASGPLPLDRLTIREKIKSPYCTWQGYVTDGKVYWNSPQ